VKQLKGDVQEFINRSKHGRYISSIPQLNGNSIEFSLSTQTRRVIKSPQAKLLQDKAQDTIFGLEAIGEKSRGKKDPDAMEIDKIQRKEGKSLRYCQICAGKGFKNKSKTHNTVGCYDKPSNEDKCSYKTSSQKPSPLGPSKNKNQSFRAQLIKMLEEDSDDPDSPSEDVKINSVSIEEILDPVPPSGKGKGTPKLDFPLGL